MERKARREQTYPNTYMRSTIRPQKARCTGPAPPYSWGSTRCNHPPRTERPCREATEPMPRLACPQRARLEGAGRSKRCLLRRPRMHNHHRHCAARGGGRNDPNPPRHRGPHPRAHIRSARHLTHPVCCRARAHAARAPRRRPLQRRPQGRTEAWAGGGSMRAAERLAPSSPSSRTAVTQRSGPKGEWAQPPPSPSSASLLPAAGERGRPGPAIPRTSAPAVAASAKERAPAPPALSPAARLTDKLKRRRR